MELSMRFLNTSLVGKLRMSESEKSFNSEIAGKIAFIKIFITDFK